MVTGPLVTSLVVPDTVRSVLLVTKLSCGLVTSKVGGVVSTVILRVTVSAALPSLSDTLTVMVCAPSPRAFCGVYVIS